MNKPPDSTRGTHCLIPYAIVTSLHRYTSCTALMI